MLGIRKGKSSRVYENDFFRQISSTLSRLFNAKGWKGMLFGMPECVTREDLQIDALLVTEHWIIIIDFKNYEGEVILPPANRFECGSWTLESGVIVRGGSAANPFKQLQKQRSRLAEELTDRLPGFERKSIYTMVCFQNEMKVMGEIPGRHRLNFGIADARNYADKVFDILDVSAEGRDYLSESNRIVFEQTVFNAQPYDAEDTWTTPPALANPVQKLQQSNEEAMNKIASFLESESRVLVLSGTTQSGKTSLIPKIRETGFDKGFSDTPVFAYSARLRRNMLEHNPELEDVESLFSTIFDFKDEHIDEHYRKQIPLKTREDDREHEAYKTLYMIDDSQLISNSKSDSEFLKFGTGHLLEDLLSFLDLETNKNDKIVFIGDKNKLSYGSKVENALNPSYLQSLLESKNLFSEVVEIELANAESESEIVKTCQKIAVNLKQNQFNDLMISSKGSIRIGNKSEQTQALRNTYLNPNTHRVIVYTNEHANRVNRWIKQKLAQNGDTINVKDFVIFNSSIRAYVHSEDGKDNDPFDLVDEPRRIDNGMFGIVTAIDLEQTLIKSVRLKNGAVVELRFVPGRIKLQDGTVVELLVFDNFLNADRGGLDTGEIAAYQIILSELEKEFMTREPFEKSSEYAEMVRKGEYISEKDDNDRVFYRDKNDKRKLTEQEKTYRKKIRAKLNRRGSLYFDILNAAKIKFAWCMTVNKAMAYKFDTVFFDTEQGENRGKTNADYFKWLYTGLSIGQNQVSLIKWQPISPFLHTEFSDEVPTNIPKNKEIIMTLSNGEEHAGDELGRYLSKLLAPAEAAVVNLVAKPYLEIATVQVGGEEIQLFFDYNKRGEIKVPRLKKGSEESFRVVLEALAQEDLAVQSEPGEIQHRFTELIALLDQENIKTKIKFSHDWQAVLGFSCADEKADVQVWYTGGGMVSKFNFLQGSLDIFEQVVGMIRVTYGLGQE
ncbi:nuclease-related domain-containing protein [Saccharibacillus qingshengii]|uniref:nuclease-related domain-containing protein n=1 Tax=Saccharibacillus qingshengii TaxID=1763540 RepID=UPI001552156B|nr:nuclease-related domain-containing protein [Saccharibacillus qingshengii]